MIRTRVGYAGGTTESPTYQRIGDHTESLQVDFDHTQISYEELVRLFWGSHDPREKSWSKQYMSIAFFHNEEQEEVLSQTKKTEAEKRKADIFTTIRPFEKFYLAEDYHQKYYLQQSREIMQELKELYPNFKDFVDSTLAARLNGYVAVNRPSLQLLEKQSESLSLLPEDQKKLSSIISSLK